MICLKGSCENKVFKKLLTLFLENFKKNVVYQCTVNIFQKYGRRIYLLKQIKRAMIKSRNNSETNLCKYNANLQIMQFDFNKEFEEKLGIFGNKTSIFKQTKFLAHMYTDYSVSTWTYRIYQN